jgi:hypothetical protein
MYYWHHPALYLIAICNLIIYAIVALIFRRRAALTVGLCPTHAGKRRNGVLLGWAGALAGIAVAILGGANENCGVMAGGALLFLGTIIAGMFMARVLYPQRIDKSFARLKGCGERFLAELPDFNG